MKAINYLKSIRLSNWLLVLTVLQYLYVLYCYYNPDEPFTYQHEDYIFIAHFMTWFIVRAIENSHD